jgi:HK97 family phage portal protein
MNGELSTLRKPLQWLLEALGVSNESVTSATMHAIPAVWYALQKIGGDIGKMPLDLYKTNAPNVRGSTKLVDHPLTRLMRNAPNNYQTADLFKEMITTHALAWGNGRAWIRRENGIAVELLPLLPDRTDTFMVEGVKWHLTCPDVNDPIVFHYMVDEFLKQGATSQFPPETISVPDYDVLHIMGLGYSGVKGWNVARALEDAFTAARSGHRLMRKQTQKGFTGRIMLNDAGGAFAGRDAQKEATEFLEKFRKDFGGDGGGEVAGLLRRGMTADVLTMSNADAQMIEQMRFSRQDVMLVFGLPNMPGDDSATSYNSMEQSQLQYLASCLDRWLVRWENECQRKLLTVTEYMSNQYYFKFNTATWIKMDAATTANVMATHIRSTVLNPNEAREMLDRNPRPGGDDYMNPAIQTSEPSQTTRADQARNQWNGLLKVEAKRIAGIANSKTANSLQALEQRIAKHYVSWHTTIADVAKDNGIEPLSYCNARLDELRELIASTNVVTNAKAAIVELTQNWIKDI